MVSRSHAISAWMPRRWQRSRRRRRSSPCVAGRCALPAFPSESPPSLRGEWLSGTPAAFGRPRIRSLAYGILGPGDVALKKIGFLSFGHWTDAYGSQVRSAADSLLQSVELAVAAEELGADGAYFR